MFINENMFKKLFKESNDGRSAGKKYWLYGKRFLAVLLELSTILNLVICFVCQ